MAKPLKSNFAEDNSLDTHTTLFPGKAVATTPVLTAELSESETEAFHVDDTNGAPNKGFAVIEDEIISYNSRRRYKALYLQRGVNGTTPVIHAAGTTVTFTPAYFVPPALVDAVIEMQVLIREHKERLEKLEKPK